MYSGKPTTQSNIRSINPIQVVKKTECKLNQIQGIHQVQLSKNFGGSFKEVIRQCFVLFNNMRDLPPRLHVTRVWPSKASSCLLGARFKSLLYAWIFILSWDIEILSDNSCHIFTIKSCVKKFCGGKINEIYSRTISCADVNVMPHCLTSKNKHAIKLTMQSTDDVYNIQCRLARYILTIHSCILIKGLPILVWG